VDPEEEGGDERDIELDVVSLGTGSRVSVGVCDCSVEVE
jgi:hypothetical protein